MRARGQGCLGRRSPPEPPTMRLAPALLDSVLFGGLGGLRAALDSLGFGPLKYYNCLIGRIESSHTAFPFLRQNAAGLLLDSHPPVSPANVFCLLRSTAFAPWPETTRAPNHQTFRMCFCTRQRWLGPGIALESIPWAKAAASTPCVPSSRCCCMSVQCK